MRFGPGVEDDDKSQQPVGQALPDKLKVLVAGYAGEIKEKVIGDLRAPEFNDAGFTALARGYLLGRVENVVAERLYKGAFARARPSGHYDVNQPHLTAP